MAVSFDARAAWPHIPGCSLSPLRRSYCAISHHRTARQHATRSEYRVSCWSASRSLAFRRAIATGSRRWRVDIRVEFRSAAIIFIVELIHTSRHASVNTDDDSRDSRTVFWPPFTCRAFFRASGRFIAYRGRYTDYGFSILAAV